MEERSQNFEKNINQPRMGVEDEKAPVGFKILSFLIPIVGLIMYLVKHEEQPRYAKGCGISALVGFLTMPIIAMVLFSLIIGTNMYLYNTKLDKVELDNSEDMASKLEQSSIGLFNNTFEVYAGTQSYATVKNLMNIINRNNLTDSAHSLTVTFDGRERTANEVAGKISPEKSYRVKFHYNLSGLIDEVKVNTIR